MIYRIVRISYTMSTRKSKSPKRAKSKKRSKSRTVSKRVSAASKAALLIIDMQYDFLEGGSLAVPGGNDIIKIINKLRAKYPVIVLSKDWHPNGHVSFAKTHDKPVFTMLGSQMLWPVHCVQGSHGAKIHSDVIVSKTDIIIEKGTHLDRDSYSAFFDNDHKSQTKLDKILRSKNIKSVDVCGLAYDYCVGSTALDANKLGYKTRVIKNASAAVNSDSANTMTERLKKAGIVIVKK
jgi:nicotinamidase/pyrazinamidase